MLKSSLSRKTWFAWVVLVAGILAAVFASLQVKYGLENDAKKQFTFTCDQVTLKIQERLDAYALILRGASALFAASTTVDRQEWRAYVETLQPDRSVSGVQGIGFAQVVPADQLVTHIARIRSEGFPEYTVRPSGERPVYTSIVFLEPFRDRNLRAFGYDMFSEPVRRTAMEQARDTGEAALSGKVELVQETGNEVQAGTLMYVPVYRNDMPRNTLLQRRAALIGWTYSAYRMNDLMAGFLRDWVSQEGKTFHLQIYDENQAASAGLLFDSNPAISPDVHLLFKQQRTIDFNGHQWLLMFDHTGKPSGINYQNAWATLIGGFALSGLLSGLLFSIINTRANAFRIAEGLTEEIRHSQELLKESETFKLSILNSLAAEIVVVDRDWVIQGFNEPWLLSTLENGTELGKPAPHIEAGDNYLAVCQISKVFTSPPDILDALTSIQAVLDGDLPNFSMEYSRHTPTQHRWFTMTVLPLGQNKNRGVVITHTDITERKQAEALFHGLFDQSSFLAVILDQQRRLVVVNNTALLFTETPREEIIGKYYPDTPWWSNAQDRDKLIEVLSLAYEGTHASFEATHTIPAGGYINVLYSAMPIYLENGIFLAVTGVDITERKRAEQELRISEERLSIITSSAQDAIIMLDEAGNILFWNKAAENMFGYTRDEVIGHYLHTMLAPQHFREAHLKAFPHFQQTGQGAAVGRTLELAGIRKDGSEFALELSLSAVQVKGVWHSIGMLRDITERKQIEEKLRLAANVFTHAREGIMITTADGEIIDVNDAFCDITGYKHDEVLGKNPRILKSGLHEKAFYAAMWGDLIEKGHWYGEVWNRRKNGEVYAEMQTISAVRERQDHTRQYVALFTDITPFKEHEQKLERSAHYDALTNLPNRVLLADRLHQGIAQTRRRGQWLAVAYLDLDGFKAINDRYGHEAGDQLLVSVATRIKQALREDDTLARMGGDEFVAVLLDSGGIEASASILTRMLAAAAQPVLIDNYMVQVTASLGVTFYSQTEDIDADQLLRQADQAMYRAKLTGKNRYHIFDAEQDNRDRTHYETLEHIHHALKAREFVLYYQPKVNMRTGTFIGAEALIRWQHPERGLLPPDLFLPPIDDHPLSIELGEWVIESALLQMDAWRATGLNIPVSVNIGSHQLQRADFIERLHTLLAAHPDVRPGDLELEVLETSAVEDLTKVSRVIEASQKLGVSFALDDFGTGYSSLTYLKRLPVTRLKIDQSFVRDIINNADDLAIVEGVIGLATAFRHQVIAEGVETVEHGTMLLQIGCDFAQGYGIARPMPAHELLDWAANWRPDPAWVNMQPIVSRVDLPLLFASAEHRSWIEAIENYLKDEREDLPPMDHHQCRFSIWLDAEGLARYGSQPAFQAVEMLHRQVHELAIELSKLKAKGRKPEALARFGELQDLRNALLEQLLMMQENLQ